MGFHGPTSPPKDKREKSEQEKEAENKGKEIVTTRERTVMILIVKKTFFFNDIDVFPRFGVTVVVVDFAGTGETARGGVGMRWRTHWTDDRSGVEGGSCFFTIVRWTLDIVGLSTRGSCGGRSVKAGNLGVCLCMHLVDDVRCLMLDV